MKRSREDYGESSAVLKRRSEFNLHLGELNKSFAVWLKENQNCGLSLSSGAEDYRDYVATLRSRYLSDAGVVMTFGSGDCGQLAHGIEEDDDLMVKFPRKVLSLADKQVVGISCGGLHNAVCTASGAVYTWGCNDDGSLGRVGTAHAVIRVTEGGMENEIIIGVACGDGQTLCLSINGGVFGWGCYKDKEGKKFFNPSSSDSKAKIKKQQDTPIAILGLPSSTKVVDIACGSAHNLALCADGSVYSWGLGESGELGRKAGEMKFPAEGDEEQEYDLTTILTQHITPLPMLGWSANGKNNARLLGARCIGAGAYHSLVGYASAVYSTGLNNYGQLGHGDTENRCELAEVSALRGVGVKMVKGGVHHSLVLTSSGRLLAFGRGDSGQTGIVELSSKGGGEAGSYVPVPVLVPIPGGARPGPTVTSISCGGNHNLALTYEGSVYSWGYGDMLALGHGIEADEAAPRKLNLSKARGLDRDQNLGDNLSVSVVSGGGQHSAFVVVPLKR